MNKFLFVTCCSYIKVFCGNEFLVFYSVRLESSGRFSLGVVELPKANFHVVGLERIWRPAKQNLEWKILAHINSDPCALFLIHEKVVVEKSLGEQVVLDGIVEQLLVEISVRAKLEKGS